MSLKLTIQDQLKTSLKTKDATRVLVLRMLISAIKNEEIAQVKREEGLSDEEITAVIARQIKQRKDSIEQFIKGERMDLAEKEQKELSILQTFMPEQMSDEKIRSIAREIIAGGKSGFGAVMSAVMQQVKGKTDGGVVKKIVEETLTSQD
ncbi:MAG: GatB/YqeY domain-containing protein [Parcubacteria group bacterium GW2011_GWC2_44_17]|uniref:Glutamyl-tRNA amidotransferase n=1 Tax=Candidatus Jacksonbacteria bacterium RIFCSPLOWO2_02_FULL_44_20 TaxID=1798460 RepID=A0A1G2A9Z3_9BACT|nr:MAG: GatB/YqeY domain-containing protein [Parcubacteria group bacterium GW2011_GWC2_44_17]KKT49108.1 MAG: GatB/YqeY domain-containing protein [Parcubacteria group bacterium GW2011_GWF2_44_17]OGY69753.1 MAG: hypothetical protein A3C00_04560 [Candidatus Jacksonbacteria bacterium RIFCSPHIGHO2_02_FULL_44_25]OGY70984.1 MAG: hypothetical protein A3E05_00700 [Candidatus Jacksonbacteria bacterium RIFCSPHIGHO2_12_FULL_44_12]OGY73632.1 MAG: hypothetical protein A3H61_00375 [Candidatus Jacksonbacteria 